MSDSRHIVQAYNTRTVLQTNKRAQRMAAPLNRFLKNSKGMSPVLAMLILVATGVAASLASATWMQSLTYSFMKYEDLQITGLHFYEGADTSHGGGITIDSMTIYTGYDISFTFSHTCSGSNRLLVVSIHCDNGIDVSSVTYGGTSPTQVSAITHNNGKPRVEVWRLIAPSTGSHNVQVTLSGGNSDKVTIGAISYNGVDQTTPIDGATSAQGTGPTASVTVTSESGDLVQDAMTAISDGASTVGSGQTQRYNVEMGGSGVSQHYGAASTQVGTTSVQMTWSLTEEQKEWVIIGFNIMRAHTSFSGLPEVIISGTYENVVIDEPSDIKITGSHNNVTVVGKPHNIEYVGGNNNLTLVSPGTIIVDVENPYVTLTQISGGWLVMSDHPVDEPIIKGDINLISKGSQPKRIYIVGNVIFSDSSFSTVAVTIENTGTCDVKITKVLLSWEPAAATPIPCTLKANSEISISIYCNWVAGEIYRISIFTLEGNFFNFAAVAE